jgi:hypothetical protein
LFGWTRLQTDEPDMGPGVEESVGLASADSASADDKTTAPCEVEEKGVHRPAP